MLKKTLLLYPSELPHIWNTLLRFSIFQCLVVHFSDKYRLYIYSLNSFFSFVKLTFITFFCFFIIELDPFFQEFLWDVCWTLSVCIPLMITAHSNVSQIITVFSEEVQSISFQGYIAQQFWHWSYFKVIFRDNISHWLPSFGNRVKYKNLKICWHQSDKI